MVDTGKMDVAGIIFSFLTRSLALVEFNREFLRERCVVIGETICCLATDLGEALMYKPKISVGICNPGCESSDPMLEGNLCK